MTTKELIKAEIDNLEDDQNLEELYEVIKGFIATKSTSEKPNLMTKLQHIKINAPADFSANLELYASGEKRV